MQVDINKALILLVRHGSHAYGINTETSDLDTKGVFIPSRDYVHGIHVVEQVENSEELEGDDSVAYEIRKFFRLAMACNPNIIEVLHVDPEDILWCTEEGDRLLENRNRFLSKKARFTFAGYAHAQLKRIKTHRAWLLNPPKKKPERSDFGLPDHNKVVNDSALGAIEVLGKQGYSFSEELMTAITREKQYAAALNHWKQYCNWKENRNKARAELEAKYGFDTKHATHLIRLGRMCLEILSGKGVIVKRPDKEELLAIRSGAWSYDTIVEYAEKLDAEADKLYKTSVLQHSPDVEKINELCMELVESHLEKTNERTPDTRYYGIACS